MQKLCLILLCFFISTSLFASSSPDFKNIKSVQKRNQVFIQFITNKAKTANEHILATRNTILQLQAKKQLTRSEINWLQDIAKYYDMNNCNINQKGCLQRLLMRVDVVPVSLALAQAINETAWGTSRFAREGKNYFGLWCYTPGCGLVPLNRQQYKSHEVTVFQDPLASVEAYMQLLNTNPAFERFRQARVLLRVHHRLANASVLVSTMGDYAQNGKQYVRILNTLIQRYNLNQYDV